MTVGNKEFELMVEDMTSDLISLAMEREGLSMPEAFNKVYTSQIYDALRNSETICLSLFMLGVYFRLAALMY